MPAKGVSKRTGILRAAELLGIDTDCIFCVGDQTNDLPMVTAFHGFAVSNAVPALKEAAPYSCDRITDMIDRILSGEFETETSKC
jgi:hydroxymethylpyrimidine pyrophosphatase-like HAD family hydrolase